MKYTVLLILALFSFVTIFANNTNNSDFAEWTYILSTTDDGNFEITLSVDIDENWYIYGMNIIEGGPLPLYIGFKENDNIKIIDEFTENHAPEEKFDKVFNMSITAYEESVEFSAIIENNSKGHIVTLIIDGQACYTKDGRCVQVYEEIEVELM